VTGQNGTSGATGVRGPTGPPGATGARGPTGAGARGPTGIQGPPGPRGPTGAQGLRGATGPAGTAGTVAAPAIPTAESTTSITYANLATVGPAVTVDVPASGRVLISVTAGIQTTTGSALGYMSFAMSGTNTSTGSDATALNLLGNNFQKASATFVLTGLTPGSTTFTAVYRTTAGTATFQNRSIWLIPL
jgi:collagen triple helix repeat protein